MTLKPAWVTACLFLLSSLPFCFGGSASPEDHQVDYDAQTLLAEAVCPGAKVISSRLLTLAVEPRPILTTPVNAKVRVSLKKRIGGVYRIRLGFFGNDEYSLPDVFLDKMRIPHKAPRRLSGKTSRQTLEFLSPLLDSGLHQLDLSPQANKRLALEYIDYQLDSTCFKPISPQAWQSSANPTLNFPARSPWETSQAAGYPQTPRPWEPARSAPSGTIDLSSCSTTGTVYAATHLYRPIPWSHYRLVLEAESPAELLVNGVSQGTTTRAAPVLKAPVDWNQTSKYTAIRVVVKMAAGKHAAFRLLHSPLSGGEFRRDIPAFISEKKANDDWPRHTLSNGLLTAVVALPDDTRGFYRGMRFERAGIVTSLQYQGHEFFTRNFDSATRNPVIHDHVAGQAEEFAEPLGYAEAATGEAFLKIGVGLLRKPFYPIYAFRVPYAPVKILPWRCTLARDRAEFTQEATLGVFGYRYRKTIRLAKNKATLTVNYELTNTGTKPIVTSQYAHNFIAFDESPSSGCRLYPGFSVLNPALPDGIKAAEDYLSVAALPSPQCFRLNLPPRQQNSPAKILDPAKGMGLELHGDFRPDIFQLFISRHFVCPEMFVVLNLKPGEVATWTRSYKPSLVQ
jgi:hypothetical protein